MSKRKLTVLLLVEVTPHVASMADEELIGYRDQVINEVRKALMAASYTDYPWRLHNVRQAVAP